jgi:hypothetical protein
MLRQHQAGIIDIHHTLYKGCWGSSDLMLHSIYEKAQQLTAVCQLRRHQPVGARWSDAHLRVLHRLVAGVLDLLHWVCG